MARYKRPIHFIQPIYPNRVEDDGDTGSRDDLAIHLPGQSNVIRYWSLVKSRNKAKFRRCARTGFSVEPLCFTLTQDGQGKGSMSWSPELQPVGEPRVHADGGVQSGTRAASLTNMS